MVMTCLSLMKRSTYSLHHSPGLCLPVCLLSVRYWSFLHRGASSRLTSRRALMLWYKAWRESSWRFFISAAIIAVMCLFYTFFHGRLYASVAHDHPNIHNYV